MDEEIEKRQGQFLIMTIITEHFYHHALPQKYTSGLLLSRDDVKSIELDVIRLISKCPAHPDLYLTHHIAYDE